MSLSTTGRVLITDALQTLQVFSPDQVPTAPALQRGLSQLQEFVDWCSTQALTILVVDRHEFPLIANQGGPANPYTIGPGGDFDTGSQARPIDIETANLLLAGSPYPVEIPMAMDTDDSFAANQIKTLSNPLATRFYYNPTDPLGTIILWPIPNTAVNSIVLYYDRLTAQFGTLDAAYICPPGFMKAFRLNLAWSLVPFFAVPPAIAAWVKAEADQALTDVKLINVKMADLGMDGALTPQGHKTDWNIFVGP